MADSVAWLVSCCASACCAGVLCTVLWARFAQGTILPLRTSSGKPVSCEEASGLLNTNFNLNEYYMDTLGHIVAENIPERVIHAKGSGAFGYFEVTENFSQYTRAKLFEKIGKKTPVAVRFSPATRNKGGSELGRDARGMAIKFYTEDGNFDLITFSFPIFIIKDPIDAPSFTHMFKRNPVTNVEDVNALWDISTLKPEALHILLYFNSDQGIPDGYRRMNGYNIHTLQMENEEGELYFARFHFYPENGTSYLNNTQAAAIADPDYFTRDLYNNIAAENYPAWKMYAQLLTHEQVKEEGSVVFDVTRILPIDKYPLQEIGRLVLNRNPRNYFTEVEQLGFCPSHLVPGITGAPDALYEGRRLAYRLARTARLGINANNIPVNSPLEEPYHYLRDGHAPNYQSQANTNGPNYYPNSFNGPVPIARPSKKLITIVEDPKVNNYDQANEFYCSLPEDEQSRLFTNLVGTLSLAEPFLQDRAIEGFSRINTTLSSAIAVALGRISSSS